MRYRGLNDRNIVPRVAVSETAAAQPTLPRIKVRPRDAVRIVAPYGWDRLREQLVSVMPIVFIMAVFQYVVLAHTLRDTGKITAGVIVVMVGLALFMEGVKIGLMPLGETLGSALPVKCSMAVTLAFALCLGFLATFAEPAVGAIQQAGSGIDPAKAPLLYELLNRHATSLAIAVGIGVAVAALVGTLRFLENWRLEILVLPVVLLVGALSLWAHFNPQTRTLSGLAWDFGAVVAGPVNTPLLLALGIGVCSSMGRSDTGMAGFGVVTLASLFPVVTVLALGLGLYHLGGVDLAAVAATAHGTTQSVGDLGWGAVAWRAFVDAARAIFVLSAFLLIFQIFVTKEKVQHFDHVAVGIGFCLLGLTLFNFGIGVGLSPLGDQVGSRLPAAFHPAHASLFGPHIGRAIAIFFGLLLGYAATLAEPAFSTLGNQVEEITAGAFKKLFLVHSVALGVGVGMAFGVVKLVYDVPLALLLLPAYALLLVMTWASKEEFVNIAWDSGAVTTGPITVPLVIAMGLGITGTIGLPEGFGILALASVWPVVIVLGIGFAVERKRRRKEART